MDKNKGFCFIASLAVSLVFINYTSFVGQMSIACEYSNDFLQFSLHFVFLLCIQTVEFGKIFGR